jgi:hypothetical protein
MANLKGSITIDRRLLDHDVWNRDPACYRGAWIDLIALANDEDRVTTIHGEPVPLKRGQLAWSQRRLEQRWMRSEPWVKAFLKFCQDQTMITVDANRRRTIITVINYEVYNPRKTGTDLGTDVGTEQVTETGTDLGTDVGQKGETGRGSRKGEGNPPKNEVFAETPSERELIEFGRAFPGDISRGIPAQIPEPWILGWVASQRGPEWAKKWREKMRLNFVSDWLAGYAKARASMPAPEKKSAAGPDGRTPAQRRYDLSKELEAVKGRLDDEHYTGRQPNAADVRRESELEKMLEELGQ